MNQNIAFKILKIVSLNLALFFVLDRVVFHLFLDDSKKLNYSFDSYDENYRGYFKDSYRNKYGDEIFFIDRKKETNRVHSTEDIPSGALRVLAFGDSFTYGQGVYLEDTYPKQLEILFKEKKGQKIYAQNLGKSGDDILQIFDSFQTHSNESSPKVIVYAYVLNDVFIQENLISETPLVTVEEKDWKAPAIDFINTRNHVFKKVFSNEKSWFSQISRIYSVIEKKKLRREISKRTIQHYNDIYNSKLNPIGFSRTFDLVQQMSEESRKEGAHFAVFIFPLFFQTQKDYPFENIHKIIKEELTKRNVEVIDGWPAYKGIPDKDLWVHPIDQHPNNYAHKIMAEVMFDWISSKSTSEQ